MKSIIVRNGVWSALFLIGISVLPLLFLGLPDKDSYKSGEVIGYASIILSMVFVVLGMRQKRIENGGHISYWKAVKTGLLIALFPAVAFGLYNVFYSYVIDPEFITKYTEYAIEERGAGKSADEMEVIKQSVEAEMAIFDNPFLQFILMFLTVFPIGLLVALVAGFFIKKKAETA